MGQSEKDVLCPITEMLRYIGGRWKSVILFYLSSGQKRFGEIAARIPTISRKVLTQQLKEMESDGLIVRMSFKENPPRVEYDLTDLGRSLSSVFREMATWGKTSLSRREEQHGVDENLP